MQSMQAGPRRDRRRAQRGAHGWTRRGTLLAALALAACRPDGNTPPPGGGGGGGTKGATSVQQLIIDLSGEIARFGFPVELKSLLMETRKPEDMREVAETYVGIVRKPSSHEAFAQLRRALEVPPLTNGAGLRAGIVQMLQSATLVGYLHDRDTIVMRTDALELRGPLEHALTRALMFAYMDQSLGGLATSVLDAQSTSDTALVRQCLAEGFATYVADTIHASRRNRNEAVPTNVPAALLGTHASVPCAPGTSHVARLHASGGWQAVLTAFAQPPTSIEQILHANKFEKDFPVHVELPYWPEDAGDAEQIHDDVLGELAIERLLRERGYDDATASQAATGWDGDRLGMWRVPSGESVIVWRSVWDRDEDAEQFAGAIAPFTKSEPRGFRIVRRGRMVDAVSAESEDIATKWYVVLQDALDTLGIEPTDAVSTREAEAEPAPRPR